MSNDSTVILGSLVGRHCIAVEYEPRFCDMIRDSIARIKRQATLTPKGRVTCIHGDARKLGKILTPDAIIFSPPYGNRLADAAIHDDDPQRVSYRQAVDVILTSPPFGPSSKGGGIFVDGYKAPGEAKVSDPGLPERQGRPLSEDPRNIDNLKYGNIGSLTGGRIESLDKIYIPISCTPFQCRELKFHAENVENRVGLKRENNLDAENVIYEALITLSTLKNEIAKSLKNCEGDLDLPFKVQEIPTGKVVIQDGVEWDGKESTIRLNKEIIIPAKNVGEQETRLRYAFITSYPGRRGDLQHLKILLRSVSPVTIKNIKLALENTFIVVRFVGKNMSLVQLCKESAQIQNVGQPIILRSIIGGGKRKKKPSYLSEMLQVYQECHKVLKIGGLMILVVKNFSKDRQVVRLDEHTIELAEKALFTLRDRWYFKLPVLSFWLNNYYKKNPTVPRVLYEDVIIFKKYGKGGML